MGRDGAEQLQGAHARVRRHIKADGDLPFDYCDTVADFLQFAFGVTTDLAVHRLIITRLLEVGVSHNR